MLTQNQREQQTQCQNIDCECSEVTTQEQWSEKMQMQGWVDFGYDFTNINPVHEPDEAYDKGYQQAYDNR